MQIDQSITQKYNLTEAEIQLTRSGYVQMNVKANQFFLQEGKVCNHIGYVTKGLFRSYFYDDHANEITSEFYTEGTLIIAFDSFNNRVPSKENIKAIVDSELMVVSYEKQKALYEKVPAWNQICKRCWKSAGRRCWSQYWELSRPSSWAGQSRRTLFLRNLDSHISSSERHFAQPA